MALEIDLVMEVPLRTPEEWAGAWAWADSERRLAHPAKALGPTGEAIVLLTKQDEAKDNGPWRVRADGSHRRPDVEADGSSPLLLLSLPEGLLVDEPIDDAIRAFIDEWRNL